MGVVRRDGERRANAAVDVEPEVLSHRQIGKRSKIIDRAGVDGPSVADDAGRLKTGGAVPRECRAKHVELDAEIITGRDALKRAVSKPHRIATLSTACAGSS